jgi:hypothetical protein
MVIVGRYQPCRFVETRTIEIGLARFRIAQPAGYFDGVLTLSLLMWYSLHPESPWALERRRAKHVIPDAPCRPRCVTVFMKGSTQREGGPKAKGPPPAEVMALVIPRLLAWLHHPVSRRHANADADKDQADNPGQRRHQTGTPRRREAAGDGSKHDALKKIKKRTESQIHAGDYRAVAALTIVIAASGRRMTWSGPHSRTLTLAPASLNSSRSTER